MWSKSLLAGLLAVAAAGTSAVVSSGVATTSSSSACGERGWPATAQRAPVDNRSGYRVWHSSTGWHLRLSADAGTVLAGRVSSNRAMRVHVPTALRADTHVGSRSLSFRVPASPTSMDITFRAPCATRLSFAFATSGVRSAAGPTFASPRATGASAVLPVELGAHGQAPEPTFQVLRPQTTGIAGQIVRGPTCPIVNAAPCPPAPAVAGQVSVDTTPAMRGDVAQHVTTLTTDDNGRFQADLAPGAYTLTPIVAGPGKAAARMTTVEQGVLSDVILAITSGMYGPR